MRVKKTHKSMSNSDPLVWMQFKIIQSKHSSEIVATQGQANQPFRLEQAIPKPRKNER